MSWQRRSAFVCVRSNNAIGPRHDRPTVESETLPIQSWGTVQRRQGTFQQERGRTAHRIQQSLSPQASFWPARGPECCRGNIFLSGATPVESVTATVEAIAAELMPSTRRPLLKRAKREHRAASGRPRGVHAFLAELIDNPVLDALRAELCVPHISATPGKIDQRELVAAGALSGRSAASPGRARLSLPPPPTEG